MAVDNVAMLRWWGQNVRLAWQVDRCSIGVQASKQGREAEAGQGRRAETSKVGNTAWKYLAARQADKGELGNTNLSSRYMCFEQAYKEQVQVRWEHCCLLPSYRCKQISRQGRGRGGDLVSCIYYLETTILINIGLILRYTIRLSPPFWDNVTSSNCVGLQLH